MNLYNIFCIWSLLSCVLPSLSSHPSRSGLKKVCVRSFPSSSGILKGSLRMLLYRFCWCNKTKKHTVSAKHINTTTFLLLLLISVYIHRQWRIINTRVSFVLIPTRPQLDMHPQCDSLLSDDNKCMHHLSWRFIYLFTKCNLNSKTLQSWYQSNIININHFQKWHLKQDLDVFTYSA